MFSLYVHIPYCTAICPYCDFNVYAADPRPEGRYVGALLAEMREAARHTWGGEQLQTLYFGGGTPSLFEASSIRRIVQAASEHWKLEPGAEITLEATPESATDERLGGFVDAGVNRLSLGLESMQAKHLRRLGRLHSVEDNLRAFAAARAAGLANVSVDLIFAVPGQSVGEWEDDLAAIVALAPEHVSAYNLTYEERTPFYTWRARGELEPSPEEDEATMFSRAREVLGSDGFEAYEISSFARPGRRSRHNESYWNGTNYLGIGAGAHSYRGDGWGRRWSNERNHLRYMAAAEQRGEARLAAEELTREQAMGEFVFLGLRQERGVDTGAFLARFGEAFEQRFPQVSALQTDAMLEPTSRGYRLTRRGLLVADSVFALFF